MQDQHQLEEHRLYLVSPSSDRLCLGRTIYSAKSSDWEIITQAFFQVPLVHPEASHPLRQETESEVIVIRVRETRAAWKRSRSWAGYLLVECQS